MLWKENCLTQNSYRLTSSIIMKFKKWKKKLYCWLFGSKAIGVKSSLVDSLIIYFLDVPGSGLLNWSTFSINSNISLSDRPTWFVVHKTLYYNYNYLQFINIFLISPIASLISPSSPPPPYRNIPLGVKAVQQPRLRSLSGMTEGQVNELLSKILFNIFFIRIYL